MSRTLVPGSYSSTRLVAYISNMGRSIGCTPVGECELITPFCEVGPSQGVHFRSKCYISKLPEKSGLQLSPPMQKIGGPVLEIMGGLGVW